MKCIKIIMVAVMAGLTLISCNDQKTSKPETVEKLGKNRAVSGTNTTKNFSKGSFSIDYPTGWQLDPSGVNRTSFVILSPRLNNQDVFQENVSLMINDISSYGYTMDEFVDISIGQIKEVFLKPEIISSEPVQDERGASHKIIYTGAQRNMNLKYMQRYWLVDGKSYILTYSAQKDEFNKYLPEAQAMFDSFTIK